MISVPIFTISTYKDDSNKYSYGINVVAESYPLQIRNKTYGEILELAKNQTEIRELIHPFNETLFAFIDMHTGLRCPLIFIAIDNVIVWEKTGVSPKQLRYNEK
jgi:hypothetical protein